MNSRERQLAAIHHEITDRIPIDIANYFIPDTLMNFLGVSDIPGVLKKMDFDGRIVPLNYIGDMPKRTDGTIALNEWDDDAELGVGYSLSFPHPLINANSITEIEKYSWPDITKYEYKQAAKEAKDLSDRWAIRGPGWFPLFCRVCSLLGMEEAMVKMVLEPELFEAIIEEVFKVVYQICKQYLDTVGKDVHILLLTDDFATQKGMMISPELWRKFFKPRWIKLFDMGKSAGKFIWFHSCGNIIDILPDLINIGLDVWETVQLHTLTMTPKQLKCEYGKDITFFGAINTQRLPFRSIQEVEIEVTECIETLGKGGGYICGGDHELRPDVHPEIAVALYDSAKKFRQEGYTI